MQVVNTIRLKRENSPANIATHDDNRKQRWHIHMRVRADRAECCDEEGSDSGNEEFPLPIKPKFSGNCSAASYIRRMFHAPGVHVVAFVPVAGPVPPPIKVVTPE